MTALVIASTILFVSMLLLLTTYNPLFIYKSDLRCKREMITHHDNKTIHIVHQGNKWTTKQLELLQYIAKTYDDYQIHLLTFLQTEKTVQPEIKKLKILVSPDVTTKTTQKRNETEEKTELFFINPFRNFDALSFIEKVKRNLKNSSRFARSIPELTFEDVLLNHTNIKPETTTYKKYFLNTPLHYYWTNMDKNMLLFAGRVQELWQYGGMSFHLPLNEVLKNDTNSTGERKLRRVVLKSKKVFENLADDLVTIDGRGLHMGAKMVCHSLFGEMMVKLVAQIDSISVPTLIQQTLDAFCKRGAVNSEYCKALENQL